MTYPQLIQSLKKKDFKPLYLLEGNDPYHIDLITNYFEEHTLSEGERAFNQLVFYGKDTDPKSLIDAACRYPMMSPFQLILLKEAQDMKNLSDLLPYIEKPVPTTILVICYKYKKLDSRSKFGKTLKKNAVHFESKKLYDNQMPDWIESYLKDKQLNIRPEAAQLVAEYLGTDLSKVSNELDKLALNVASGSTIGEQEVMDNIGISKDYNVFELQKALGQRNPLKANRIINYFIANPKKNPLVMVIGVLYNYFSKVYMIHYLRNTPDQELSTALNIRSTYFLKDYKLAARNYQLSKTQEVIQLLRQFDLRSKGVDSDSTSDGDLLRELVYRILH